MKEPAPTRRNRTWTGRSQLKQSASFPANRMIQLAHAVSRATAIEKSYSQTVESLPPLAEMPPSTVTPPRPLHRPRIKPKLSSGDSALSADIAQRIEAQAVRVEQLSAELRAAMAQLKTMTKENYSEPSGTLNPELSNAVPLAQAVSEQASGTADLAQAKQNATSTAQLLRRLKQRKKSPTRLRLRSHPTRTLRNSQFRWNAHRWLRQVRRWFRAGVQLPVGMSAILSDAAIWVAIAAAARIGLQTLIQAYPVFWPPVMLLITVVALLTTYQAVFNSATGVPWAYRLLLVVAGLWLGGRL
ncbi:MAG: hypothetical protein KME12_10655 [Trichocoleus desertorum ATA4-8-CV12]|jgi:hypothetical protein|nr:hypothetical protein [Trichocoleus desertorum ATA4-8-CV12]